MPSSGPVLGNRRSNHHTLLLPSSGMILYSPNLLGRPGRKTLKTAPKLWPFFEISPGPFLGSPRREGEERDFDFGRKLQLDRRNFGYGKTGFPGPGS